MTEWPENKTMFIEQLLPMARKRLVTMVHDAPLIEAAKLLNAGADLVIVCDAAGIMVGVLTKSDIVAQISRCQGASCRVAAASVMTRNVVLCQAHDLMHEVWARMQERGLKNVPVVDQDLRPLGLLHARDILQMLLSKSENDESLLRDYVMGVGYR